MLENKNESKTTISDLGEFGLIDHLTKKFKINQKSTVKGIGDDAAVLSTDSSKEIVVTTDLLVEGVHFDLSYMPLKHLGY
ncbi:MAG: thiamine-phosphate kinase, partial [Flavobacteriaceae bacterium]|nr:thiamine-phosphate kinase [Flavobacteriaceae bacterium]